MRTLILLRHAKSSQDVADDFDRALNARGRADAPRMADWMVGAGVVPDHVLCSTARRAAETWDLMAPAFGPRPSVERRDELYLAPASGILLLIRALPARARTAAVIGHNPGMQELALLLCGGDDAGRLPEVREKFPTAALVEIRFARDRWADAGPAAGRLVRFVRPRDLR